MVERDRTRKNRAETREARREKEKDLSDLFRKANRFLETGGGGGGGGSVVDLVFDGRRGGKCFGTGRNKCS